MNKACVRCALQFDFKNLVFFASSVGERWVLWCSYVSQYWKEYQSFPMKNDENKVVHFVLKNGKMMWSSCHPKPSLSTY